MLALLAFGIFLAIFILMVSSEGGYIAASKIGNFIRARREKRRWMMPQGRYYV